MNKWNLNINTRNDTANFIINNKNKNVKLHSSASEHWCINIQPCLPTDSVNNLFSMKDLSTHEKKIPAAKLHRQYCHPPFAFLKKVLSKRMTSLWISLKNIQIVVPYVNVLNQRYPNLQLAISLTQTRWNLTKLSILT